MDQVFKSDVRFEYNWFGKKEKKAFKIFNAADIITGTKTNCFIIFLKLLICVKG